jgi:hypothetical protein
MCDMRWMTCTCRVSCYGTSHSSSRLSLDFLLLLLMLLLLLLLLLTSASEPHLQPHACNCHRLHVLLEHCRADATALLILILVLIVCR